MAGGPTAPADSRFTEPFRGHRVSNPGAVRLRLCRYAENRMSIQGVMTPDRFFARGDDGRGDGSGGRSGASVTVKWPRMVAPAGPVRGAVHAQPRLHHHDAARH